MEVSMGSMIVGSCRRKNYRGRDRGRERERRRKSKNKKHKKSELLFKLHWDSYKVYF